VEGGQNLEPRVFSIAEACAIAGIRKTTLYKFIRVGQLRAIKVGARTFILALDLYRWLDAMPPVIPDPGPSGENAEESSAVVAASVEKQGASNPKEASDMGTDLCGWKPTAPHGEYFRASIWQWPFLVKLITTLCPEETSPCKHWDTNDGDGLPAPQALALAEALERKLQAGEVALAICDATIVRDAEIPAGAIFEAWLQSQGFETSRLQERAINENFVAKFAAFVRASGGFSIW
jgi:excisionase family DNA binding protein